MDHHQQHWWSSLHIRSTSLEKTSLGKTATTEEPPKSKTLGQRFNTKHPPNPSNLNLSQDHRCILKSSDLYLVDYVDLIDTCHTKCCNLHVPPHIAALLDCRALEPWQVSSSKLEHLPPPVSKVYYNPPLERVFYNCNRRCHSEHSFAFRLKQKWHMITCSWVLWRLFSGHDGPVDAK